MELNNASDTPQARDSDILSTPEAPVSYTTDAPQEHIGTPQAVPSSMVDTGQAVDTKNDGDAALDLHTTDTTQFGGPKSTGTPQTVESHSTSAPQPMKLFRNTYAAEGHEAMTEVVAHRSQCSMELRAEKAFQVESVSLQSNSNLNDGLTVTFRLKWSTFPFLRLPFELLRYIYELVVRPGQETLVNIGAGDNGLYGTYRSWHDDVTMAPNLELCY